MNLQITSDYAYLKKQDKMALHQKIISTVYDDETNTHWEIPEGETVDNIREVIKCFKEHEVKTKSLERENMNESAKKMKTANLYRAMDTVTKAAQAVTEVEDNKNMSYAEMRWRFG